MKKIFLIFLIFSSIFTFGAIFSWKKSYKLYWFIPDGMRAEPQLFNIYKWADEGKLPNIKKLMEKGSYGYSYPNFPSHTPTNFATLLTGAYPEIHGVNDGPMHALGLPLDKVTVPGFRSSAKKVEPIWKTLETAGLKVLLLSIPGSTPPEINRGVVLRGRWGGWGADFHALNYESRENLVQRILQARAARLFFFGPQLTQYIDPLKPQGWSNTPKSFSESYELSLTGWGNTVFAYIYDSSNDKKENYDKVIFSLDKKNFFGNVKQGQWTNWQPITLKWKPENTEIEVASDVKAAVIKLGDKKFFRLRLFYNNLNRNIAFPPESSNQLQELTGPMVDFADNFPAQLIYYPEDKKIFQDEAGFSFDWHESAVSAVNRLFKPDVIIHDIYTPNQMLTSKWWMGYVDPAGDKYDKTPVEEREKLWNEVKDMYLKLDGIIGEIMKEAGNNSFIVISSDHGAVPLNKSVNINNLFAQKGWLKFTIDPQTGEPIIDWENTKVIYLKMAHIYINPKGLAGNYQRTKGSDYEKLREQVIRTLKDVKDENGFNPVNDIVKWENAKEFMRLDEERIGDLVVANAPGYGCNEEMTADLKIFSEPLVSGYKQAIKAENLPGMWTPFIMAGPGIKANNFLGEKAFPLIDQYPTIMKALNIKSPNFVQGKLLDIFK